MQKVLKHIVMHDQVILHRFINVCMNLLHAFVCSEPLGQTIAIVR